MDDLVQYFQSLLQYAEANAANLNTASQKALARLIEQFSEVLLELSQEQTPNITPQVPPLQQNIQQGMPSSNVEGFAYDPKTNKLMVRFLGEHPNRNGPIYAYENVPPNIFEIFRRGAIPAKTDGQNKWGKWWKGKYPSLGAAMYHLIKAGGYQYQRIG